MVVAPHYDGAGQHSDGHYESGDEATHVQPMCAASFRFLGGKAHVFHLSFVFSLKLRLQRLQSNLQVLGWQLRPLLGDSEPGWLLLPVSPTCRHRAPPPSLAPTGCTESESGGGPRRWNRASRPSAMPVESGVSTAARPTTGVTSVRAAQLPWAYGRGVSMSRWAERAWEIRIASMVMSWRISERLQARSVSSHIVVRWVGLVPVTSARATIAPLGARSRPLRYRSQDVLL